MSYIVNNHNKKKTKYGLLLYVQPSVSAFADNEIVSWGSNYTSGALSSYTYTMSSTASTFTIPTDSNTYFFEAALVFWNVTNYTTTVSGEYSYQFYNVTTSSWVGSIGTVTSVRYKDEGLVSSIVGDETARYATSTDGDEIQLRLKSSANNYATLEDIKSTSTWNYTAHARLMIHKY